MVVFFFFLFFKCSSSYFNTNEKVSRFRLGRGINRDRQLRAFTCPPAPTDVPRIGDLAGFWLLFHGQRESSSCQGILKICAEPLSLTSAGGTGFYFCPVASFAHAVALAGFREEVCVRRVGTRCRPP